MATVAVYIEAFSHYAEAMHLPRTLVTPHPMGRPLGPPFEPGRQREVIEAALRLVDTAEAAGAVERIGGAYRPGSPTS
ncbi:MAG: hypothetical protein IH941_11475 [Acidobacteria bacterium]|nr:hypothetical protein [Acidobacteriota bacterium]